MTKNSKRMQVHVFLIAIILGAVLSAIAINYYRLNKVVARAAIGDGTSEHFLNVRPLSNGLAKVSLIHNQQIFIGDPAVLVPVGIISSNIGIDAVTTIETN